MEPWQRKLRMGMVGGGLGASIGAVHRMAAALDGQIEFVAGCFSRDYRNTLETGRQLYLDPERCYRTYEEMAAVEAGLPPDRRVDFVTVVTPNVSHFPIARTFLQSGFHVVCDKPMTRTLGEAEQLAKTVEETGLVFVLTHNYTGHPMVRHARHLARAGALGIVRKVVLEYIQDFMMYPHEQHGHKQVMWRIDPDQAGPGGVLADIGTHCVNLLEYVTGDPLSELCADRVAFLPGRRLDEDANVLLRFKGGGKGVMTLSQVATGEENGLRLRVYGSEGAIIWAQENPDHLEFYRYGQPRQTLTRGHAEYLSAAATAGTRLPAGHVEGYLEAFANLYAGAAEAIRARVDGRPVDLDSLGVPTVQDGLRGMRFVYKAVESCEKGSVWVRL